MDTSTTAGNRLVGAGWLFGIGSAVHIVDHLRRGQGSVSEPLYYLGNFALVLQAVAVTLVVTRHPKAPLIAIAFGLPLATGFTAAHWLPEWSSLSDPVWEVEIAPLATMIASALEIGGALAMAAAGWAVVRERGGLAAFGRPEAAPTSG